MMRFKVVKEGNHKFNPSELHPFTYGKDRIYTTSFAARFDPSCEVDVYEGNDDSYNKLCGVAFNLLVSTKNSVMVGWRYAPHLKSKSGKADVYELVPYWHDTDGTKNFIEPIFTVKSGELFYVDFVIDRINNTVSVGFERSRTSNNHSNEYQLFRLNINVPSINGIARRINPWFGGQKAAPREMKLQCSRFHSIQYIQDENPNNEGNLIVDRREENINEI